jgi:hypothetical protein
VRPLPDASADLPAEPYREAPAPIASSAQRTSALRRGATPSIIGGMKAYRLLFWLFAVAAVACFAVAGWLWWKERDPPLLVVDTPLVEVGDMAAKEQRTVEVTVTNISSHPLRLVGLDGESC